MKGLKAAKDLVAEIKSEVHACKGMDEDIAAIEAWA